MLSGSTFAPMRPLTNAARAEVVGSGGRSEASTEPSETHATNPRTAPRLRRCERSLSVLIKAE
jgi:hypothetical protein